MNIQQIVVVLPTYNEHDNIEQLIRAIFAQQIHLPSMRLSILVVDDTSPDGTGELVESLQNYFPNLYLLRGNKEGLGKAYIRGFTHAIRILHADIVFEMDADFSHDPKDIPRLLHSLGQGNDFVIGSRYVYGGSIPKKWPIIRKWNSKIGNYFARHIAGLSMVKDCTSGFRAIRTSVLKRIHLNRLNVRGYAFQMTLLYAAIKAGAVVSEVPIHFHDRLSGESKIRFKDIREFVIHAFLLRLPFLKLILSYYTLLSVGVAFILAGFYRLSGGFDLELTILIITLIFSSIMSVQGLFNLITLLYAWDDTKTLDNNAAPKKYFEPHLSFSALIPARNEEAVISDTIAEIEAIKYPASLKEIIVICKSDDIGTITKVQEIIQKHKQAKIKLATFDDEPVNKPHALNVGLSKARNEIVVVFDAEDQPHPEIYSIINTVMLRDNVAVVQAGVQLMNYKSNWFSAINVLEYFFWFKSSLHYFASKGAVPLGGNTVFFKRKLLNKYGGWDEECLTEDADIGIRLSANKIKTRVIYDEAYVTREETPTDIKGFIKQRTRWNMGFMQLILKGDWMRLPKLSQRLLILYILTLPELQAFSFIFIPLSIFTMITYKMPVLFTMFTIVPAIMLLLQVIIYSVGLFEFTRAYQVRYSIFTPLRVILFFLPFQLMLGVSAFRALVRIITGNVHWEKTIHINAHREQIQPQPQLSI
jgi:glycosyltransferase XagB